jgi:uncharacterized protein (TIGR02284 family)
MLLLFLFNEKQTMHPSDLKPLKVLNNLLQINNERIQGYQQASQCTDVSVLRVLFSRLTETSLICREELLREMYKLGGKPSDENAPGDFEIAWKNIREALRREDHKALLESCYVEEFMAYKSYEYALRYAQGNVTSQHRTLFVSHREILRDDHQKVKNLRDVLLNAA